MENVSLGRNFILFGINDTFSHRVTLFSITLLYYCVILFFNISLIAIIVLDENLHEPMYILLCSFCVNELYGVSGFYPKFLLDLLSPAPDISYEGCLLQAFVMYSFACCELSILAVMAYDRYLAICRPLHYHSLMSRRRLSQLVCFSWLTPFSIFSINVLLTSRLKLCGTNLQKLFCVNWIIVELACSEADTFSNQAVAYSIMLIYGFHGLFVMWTYLHLIRTCVRSKEGSAKFMQTCVPHLASLLTFAVAKYFDLMYMRFQFAGLPRNLLNFISIEFLLIPPFINPLIYGFKLSKIRNRILCLVKGGK